MAAGIASNTNSSLGVLGTEAIEERFRRTLSRGRLASTYLFVGPDGIGKRLFATRLAKSLLCPNRSGLSACENCESCRLHDAGTHPDLLQVAKPEGKSTLPLELFLGKADARLRSGLCHDLALRPLISSRRVAIIDDADYFSVESANCLLKTLEEPPPRSVIFLIGASLARQLPTIRSRSQVVRFNKLSEADISSVLQGSTYGFPANEAESLALASGGTISTALSARDSDLKSAAENLVELLGQSPFDSTRLGQCLEDAVKEGGTEASARRERLHNLLGAMINHYRKGLRHPGIMPEEADSLLRLLEICLDAEQALHRNANQSTLIQWIVGSLNRAGWA